MKKSKLKKLIQKIYKVEKRENITFNIVDGMYYRIGVSGTTIFGLTETSNTYCCGIAEMGDTIYNATKVNGISITEASEEEQNEYYVLAMNQIAKMLINEVEQERLRKGLATWTHVSDNPIVKALFSEYGIKNSLWKHKQTFYNPNSNNTVMLFTVDINSEDNNVEEE